MAYWLVKSEPFVFSFQQLMKDGKAMWDGVRNYTARNNLRAMKLGDQILFYHSREGLEVVGLCELLQEFYPDPTAEAGDWSAVDLKPIGPLRQPVPLQTIKSDPSLQHIALVKMGRLSVMPLTEAEFMRIMELGGGFA